MAGEIVYADLKIPGVTASSRPPQRSQQLSSSPCPRWHHIAVGVGWAGNIVLIIAVIALGVWVSQLHVSCEGQTRGALNASENNDIRIISSTECSSCLEDFRSRLKPILCEPHHGKVAEDSGCKLCPRDWQLRGDKCYWLSKERKNWTGSRDDCSGKSSRLLVIQNQEEMDSIQNVTQDAGYVWTGLKVTPPGGKWTWVDSSPLDPKLGVRCLRIFVNPILSDLPRMTQEHGQNWKFNHPLDWQLEAVTCNYCFQVSGSAAENSCGGIKDGRIKSETCGAEFKWICQKEAAVI